MKRSINNHEYFKWFLQIFVCNYIYSRTLQVVLLKRAEKNAELNKNHLEKEARLVEGAMHTFLREVGFRSQLEPAHTGLVFPEPCLSPICPPWSSHTQLQALIFTFSSFPDLIILTPMFLLILTPVLRISLLAGCVVASVPQTSRGVTSSHAQSGTSPPYVCLPHSRGL